MEQLPTDIIQSILDQFNFMDQINFRSVSKYLMINYPITNLFDNISKKNKLDDRILMSYPHIIKLNAGGNSYITDINHMKNLRLLDISSYDEDCGMGGIFTHVCGIENTGLSRLTNLTELNMKNNRKITNINHMINLRTLDATGNCKIKNSGLSRLTNLTKLNIDGNKNITIKEKNCFINLRTLSIASFMNLGGFFAPPIIFDCKSTSNKCSKLTNLTELNINDNEMVTDINSLINLQILYAEGKCGISSSGFSKLTNLTKLNVGCNKNITDINNLLNLRILSATSFPLIINRQQRNIAECGITNDGFSRLTNLTELNINNNKTITNINSLINLQILNAGGTSTIGDDGISKLTNLTKLNINNNREIKNINAFLNLRTLDVSERCGVDDEGLSQLTNVTDLNVKNNFKITDVNHMINLQILNISGGYKINDKGISSLVNLTELKIDNYTKIENIKHMTKLQKLYIGPEHKLIILR